MCSTPAAGEWARVTAWRSVRWFGFVLLDDTVQLVWTARAATIDQAPGARASRGHCVRFPQRRRSAILNRCRHLHAENIGEVLNRTAVPMAEAASVWQIRVAERIQRRLMREALNIYVSYHDVSTSSRVHSGGRGASHRGTGVSAQFIGPVGADADGQISEIETCWIIWTGLAISSVSTERWRR